jgi:hypothetical protein
VGGGGGNQDSPSYIKRHLRVNFPVARIVYEFKSNELSSFILSSSLSHSDILW